MAPAENLPKSTPSLRGDHVRGAGRFSDDILLDGALCAVFLRSPVAHGVIKQLEIEHARQLPGVVDILTAKDVQAAGFGALHAGQPPPGDGEFFDPPRPILASDRVRHLGEALAVVIARDRNAAEDALEQIDFDIDPLPLIVQPSQAIAADAPSVWEKAPDNVSFEWRAGNHEAVAAALEKAAHVVHLRMTNERLIAHPMEPRSATAAFDPSSGRWTLICGSQGASALRNGLCSQVLNVAPDRLRVITPDVGGAFGSKTPPYPEYAALLMAARVAGCPVKWTSTRQEAFLSDDQGRGNEVEGWLGLDENGRFLALRAEILTSLGAYLSSAGVVPLTRNFLYGLTGPYLTPAVSVRSRGVFTNCVPTGPYRGAGRPESASLVERLVDAAANQLGIDRVDLRRRNLIPPDRIPYSTPVGAVYDSGDFPAVLTAGLEAAEWESFGERRNSAHERGRLLGRGMALVLESAGGQLDETVDLRLAEERIEIRISAQSTGQDHGDTFATLAADTLEIPIEHIIVLAGDTDETPSGGATVGSRGAMVTGAAIRAACHAALERARAAAASALEVSEADLEYARGSFIVLGSDLKIDLLELARRERSGEGQLDPAMKIAGSERIQVANLTFPNGCHLAEVEIDPETGTSQVVRYTAVADVGTVLNPPIVEGQIMGGVLQGLGQVLMERTVHDDDGQLLSGSLMDYSLPRAEDAPAFCIGYEPRPSPATPLGAKGAGESGTTGALPAILNAINDALRSAGAEPVDMPATSEIVHRSLSRVSR